MLTREQMLKETLIDADGHILEPPDMWERYIDPKYRDRAIRIKPTGQGDSFLEIDGKPSAQIPPALLGGLGGMDRWTIPAEDLRKANIAQRAMLRQRIAGQVLTYDVMDGGEKRRTYVEGCALGAMDPGERLQVMDRQGLKTAVLFPTIGIMWEAELPDPVLAGAHCQAYNRWIVDFCSGSKGRLVPIAHISLADPAGAVRELERSVKAGCRGAFFTPNPNNRKPPGHPDHDRVFAAAQDLDVPLGMHPCFEPPEISPHDRFEGMVNVPYYVDLCAPLMMPPALSTFFIYGVFERFPKLRLLILESGAGWIRWWLDRADGIYYTVLGGAVPLDEPPSYYFRRQCYISADPEETSVAGVLPLVGEDNFIWASDYPHADRSGNFVDQLCVMTNGMTPSARRKILNENATRIFGLG